MAPTQYACSLMSAAQAIQANCEADIEQSAVEEALREADRT